jgi:lysyl-tRNA synthetase class 2
MKVEKSSTVSSISYTETGDLLVGFLNGTEYIYKEVPKSVFEDMKKSESVGKFLNSNIKGKFTYQKQER